MLTEKSKITELLCLLSQTKRSLFTLFYPIHRRLWNDVAVSSVWHQTRKSWSITKNQRFIQSMTRPQFRSNHALIDLRSPRRIIQLSERTQQVLKSLHLLKKVRKSSNLWSSTENQANWASRTLFICKCRRAITSQACWPTKRIRTWARTCTPWSTSTKSTSSQFDLN